MPQWYQPQKQTTTDNIEKNKCPAHPNENSPMLTKGIPPDPATALTTYVMYTMYNNNSRQSMSLWYNVTLIVIDNAVPARYFTLLLYTYLFMFAVVNPVYVLSAGKLNAD